MKAKRVLLSLILVTMFTMVMFVSSAVAATAPTLGAAGSFGVLAGSTVTNTGPTQILGNVGVAPGTAIVGFPPGEVDPPGEFHAGDATALDAQGAVTTAYNNLAGQPCTVSLTDQDLGGLTLTPGVYCFSSSAQLTGTLTLNTLGNPEAVFVFQVGSTLTTASNASVVFTNSQATCNIFWQVGSSATLGTGTEFEGNVLALTSITANTGANIEGRLLARNGAVTLDSNNITGPYCQTPVYTDDGDTGGTGTGGGDDTSGTGTGGGDDTSGTGGPETTGTVFTSTNNGLTPLGIEVNDQGNPRSTPAKVITTSQALVATGINAGPMALAGSLFLLLGAAVLLEERRRSKKVPA